MPWGRSIGRRWQMRLGRRGVPRGLGVRPSRARSEQGNSQQGECPTFDVHDRQCNGNSLTLPVDLLRGKWTEIPQLGREVVVLWTRLMARTDPFFRTKKIPMKPHKLVSLLALPLVALLPVACGGGEDLPELDPAQVSAGKALFEANACNTCHGDTGKGDGAAAANLPVQPRNYTDKAWQKKTTDESIKKVIKEGGAANGLNAIMVAYPKFSDQELDQLVAFIRSFGR